MNLETPEVRDMIYRAQQSHELAKAYVVDNADMYVMAGDELKEIKARRKAIEDKRVEITKPMDQAKKAAMDFFRLPIDLLDDAEDAIKRAMLTWKSEQDRKEREAREAQAAEARRIQAEAKAKNPDQPPPVVVMPPVPTVAAPKMAGISTRKIWKFDVTDPAAVPREYLVIDDAKLGAMARATKGTVAVPGVRFYEEETMAAGRG